MEVYKRKRKQTKGNIMNDGRRILAATVLAAVDLAALVALRPDAGALAAKITAPHAWVAESGPDGAAISLGAAGLWCVALWLGVGLLAAVATALPGSCGALARTIARVLLPAAVYRLVAGATGLSVLLAPVAAVAAGATPSTGGTSPAAASTSAPPVPTPTWPTDPPPLPTPGWPTTTQSPAPSGPTDAIPKPNTHPPHSARPARHGGDVVVRPGDSLWGIATAQLAPSGTPAQTAAAWPRWYAANRTVIGADPGLIKPGQRLAPPAPTGGP
jgi:hypothetical protein